MADLNAPEQTTMPHAGSTAPLPSVNDIKSQATQAASDARASLSGLATEARDKVNAAVDNQKVAGAEQLAGLAQAAHAAAGDLEGQSPAMARVVRDAAASVDRFAGDLRNSDVRDIVASVTSFARQQPVAFFAGSVLVGFALARFLKSETTGNAMTSGGTSSDFRQWSNNHQA